MFCVSFYCCDEVWYEVETFFSSASIVAKTFRTMFFFAIRVLYMMTGTSMSRTAMTIRIGISSFS